MRCYPLFMIYFVCCVCPAQEMRMQLRGTELQGLSAENTISLEGLTKNKVIRDQQNKLLDLSTRRPNILVDEPSISKPVISSPLPKLPRVQETEKVVLADDLVKIKSTDSQDAISSKFCLAQSDSDCINTLRLVGPVIATNAAGKSATCTNLQKIVSAIPQFDRGNADVIPPNMLRLVVDYYNECTTAELPEQIRKVIGVLIDLDELVGEDSTGVGIEGKFYRPVGMAVQLSSSRIYSARHVIFTKVENGRFVGPRNIAHMRYIPLAAPTMQILVSTPAHPTSRFDDLADVPRDQVTLQLETPYSAPNVVWPVVERMPLSITSKPTMLYVAGLQMTLARAQTGGGAGKAAHLQAGKWAEFIRRDKTPTCTRITQSESGCMLHGCDTIGGLSGTAIFANIEGATNGPPVIIGVHNGSAFSGANVCDAGTVGSAYNLAALPDLALLKR